MPFNFSEDTVKAVSLAFNNARDFILKPAAGWTFTIALGVFLYVNGNDKYDKGVLDGRSSSKEELKSLTQNAATNATTIYSLNATVDFYKAKLDTCTKNSNADLSEKLDTMYKEQDRINKIIDSRTKQAEKMNANLKSVTQ